MFATTNVLKKLKIKGRKPKLKPADEHEDPFAEPLGFVEPLEEATAGRAAAGAREDADIDPELPNLERAEALDPVLSGKEKERRKLWMQVPADIRKELRKMHVNLGHPSNVALQRRLRRANALPVAINATTYMPCDACGDAIKHLHPRPSPLPGQYVIG